MKSAESNPNQTKLYKLIPLLNIMPRKGGHDVDVTLYMFSF